MAALDAYGAIWRFWRESGLFLCVSGPLLCAFGQAKRLFGPVWDAFCVPEESKEPPRHAKNACHPSFWHKKRASVAVGPQQSLPVLTVTANYWAVAAAY